MYSGYAMRIASSSQEVRNPNWFHTSFMDLGLLQFRHSPKVNRVLLQYHPKSFPSPPPLIKIFIVFIFKLAWYN